MCRIILWLLLFSFLSMYIHRKVIAFVHLRKGSYNIGSNILQPFADLIKLLSKEYKLILGLLPLCVLILSVSNWAVVPFQKKSLVLDINVGMLYVIMFLSFSTYSVLIGGFIKSAEQECASTCHHFFRMFSYKIIVGLVMVCVVFVTGTLKLSDVVFIQQTMQWYNKLLLLPVAIVFFFAILTKMHDVSESFVQNKIHYSSMSFLFIILSEYIELIFMIGLAVTFFCGGWYPILNIQFFHKISPFTWFFLKSLLLLVVALFISAIMIKCDISGWTKIFWKVLIPFLLFWLVFVSIFVFVLNKEGLIL